MLILKIYLAKREKEVKVQEVKEQEENEQEEKEQEVKEQVQELILPDCNHWDRLINVYDHRKCTYCEVVWCTDWIKEILEKSDAWPQWDSYINFEELNSKFGVIDLTK